ncbi:unnamed protein product [Nippostrongylus brasiliensis]|uniref:Reverse transcriptase n=1 Tax=Nippostrongylus brasiliensis TaxID=27835 RepID=A0A0N4Y1N6_NIPBR|nr:unnamed protein product [Nippostrongylus brasiliensis]
MPSPLCGVSLAKIYAAQLGNGSDLHRDNSAVENALTYGPAMLQNSKKMRSFVESVFYTVSHLLEDFALDIIDRLLKSKVLNKLHHLPILTPGSRLIIGNPRDKP